MERTLTHRRATVGLTLTLTFAAFVGSMLWLPQRQSKAQTSLTRNETASFQLVGEEKRGDYLVLKMKNVSQKGITAYSVSLEPYSRGDTDYSVSGYVIKPGDVEEIEVPLATLDSKDPSTGKKNQIRVIAVVFDDHTSEGNPGVAAMIKEIRLGRKIQLERINRIISEALKSTDANWSTALTGLKSSIASLSEEPNDEQSSYVQSGLRNAKQDVLLLIERLEQGSTMARAVGDSDRHRLLQEGLNNLMKETEKWVGRF